MSLESKLEALTAVVSQLVTVISAAQGVSPAAGASVPQAPQQSTMPAAPQPAPMPPPPTFAPQAAISVPTPPPVQAFAPQAAIQAPAVSNAPFADQKGLMDYVMNTYKALGPVKGARIQGVLGTLGYQNIGDVKPEHYGALFQGVETLKTQP